MKTWKDTIQPIEQILPVFQRAFPDIADFERFNSYTLTFHSTALEGGTLSLKETAVLLDKGLTASGKPVTHQYMVSDHQLALELTMKQAAIKAPLSVDFIKKIGGLVMNNTGGEVSTALGIYDTSKGDFRLNTVRAGSRYFVDFSKVPAMMAQLTEQANRNLKAATTLEDKLVHAFALHYDLVMIHPFGDGNGQTARLMMNYVQRYHNLPITPVRSEQRVAYIDALEKSATRKSLAPFLDFMAKEFYAHLHGELNRLQQDNTMGIKEPDKSQKAKKDQNTGKGFSLFF